MELANQPKQCEDCGKLLCPNCVKKNGRKPCPNCRTVDQRYFKDVRSKITSIGGYLVCIQIYASGFGDGEGTYVFVFTQLLNGHYDELLLWPIMGTVTYELLNQLEDNNHHSMEITHHASHDMTVKGELLWLSS